MGWIALYVIFIPLIGGAAWAINRTIKEKKARSRELERIQRRIAEKESGRESKVAEKEGDF